jgi:hypothetical protein
MTPGGLCGVRRVLPELDMSTQHTTPAAATTRTDGAAAYAASPGQRVVASFPTYEDAERAVDVLADSEFPVEQVTIVGRGLKMVERVTGRMTWIDAAARGALTGAMTGALIGWLFWVFDWFAPIVSAGWLIFDGLWFGAVVGTLIGLLAYAVTRGRRGFMSAASMEADEYDILVAAPIADEAARILQGQR